MFVHTVIMVIEPHMKQGRQHKLISTIFLATSVTKKLDHNNERSWYREALYLLAMVDYLSRINNLSLCTNYNDIRAQKLEKPCFPAGVIVSYAATGDERIKEKALANAIPEFLRFNIVEGEVRNVC